jgi:hypothetical protein
MTKYGCLAIFVVLVVGMTACGGPETGSVPAGVHGDYDYTAHITFDRAPLTPRACSVARYGAQYCDVMTHMRDPYMDSDDLTNVHESQHFMAHENDGMTPARDKFIYLRGDKAARFPEPASRTRVIYASIKDRGVTYNTYIGGRPDQELGENIVDEWRAYITEEITAIEIAKIQGQTSGVQGLVLAGVEFLYYNAAMLHALSLAEPDFLRLEQPVAIFAMLAEETKAWSIDRGINVNLFVPSANDRAKTLLNNFRTAERNAPIRSALQTIYGPEWTQRVLGF